MSRGAARFPVSPEKADALARRLRDLGVNDDDLEESFVHSGGKGGQNVNKVATCVLLVHRPSGLAIKCQEARTQGMNRYLARKRLADRIEADKLGRQSAAEQERERLRRQKRRRSRRSKNRMLADKHARTETKSQRKGVSKDD